MKSIYTILIASIAVLFVSCQSATTEEEKVVNVYTHRHYDADKIVWEKFEKATGIKLNIVSATADELIAKLEQEGELSQADVLISVDAGRIERAKLKGILQPIQSEVLLNNIAPNYRDPENYWFGMSMRARIIAVSKDYSNPEKLTYADLAKPEWKGKVLMRSSDNVYNQSLLAGIIAHVGEDSAAQWVNAVHGNFARDPKGGDRDQVRAIAAGEGAITVVNSYYIGKMALSDQEIDKDALAKVTLVFPADAEMGTHVNISASGVVKHAPHKEAAIQLLEFMAKPENQQLFYEFNREYTVGETVPSTQSFEAVGVFQPDALPLSNLGEFQGKAVSLFEKSGWM